MASELDTSKTDHARLSMIVEELKKKSLERLNVIKDYLHNSTDYDLLCSIVHSLVDTNDSLVTRIKTLEDQVSILVQRAKNEQGRLIVRQLVSSFQYRAALYCSVGKEGKRSFVDYDTLEKCATKGGHATEFARIQAEIFDNFDDEEDFKTFIAAIKSIGLDVAHPSTVLVGEEPTSVIPHDPKIIENVILEVYGKGMLTDVLKEDSMKLLHLIEVTTNLLKTAGLCGNIENLLFAN